MKLNFLTKIKLKFSPKKKLLVIGDSHTAVFNSPQFTKFFRSKYHIFVETVGGATVSGLENPNSKTEALAKFRAAHQLIKPDTLLIQLGEVDTGFVIWYRAQKYQAAVCEMLAKSLSNYRALLTELQGLEQTLVLSAPLPTIKDDQDWGEIANLRKEITASQFERTALTLKFNTEMQKITEDLGLEYINLDAQSLANNGVVSTFLLSKDVNDHHYDTNNYLSLLLPHLEKLI
ncbi:MAG: SGNH/GDSL hydrolase family protein [Paraglaciecola sp.]|nr:SGNH/GDSL hydrolase family protein [Paraglaciecola sp.]